MEASAVLLVLAAVLSAALLGVGVVLWLRFDGETRWHELGLALLSGGVLAAVVFIAQLGIDASVREADEADKARALRVSLSSNRSLEGIDLGGGTDLRGISLARKRLRYARLERADLRGASLVRADLRETNLRRTVLDSAQLRRARLQRAFLNGASLREADLSNAELAGARLHGIVAPRVKLRGAVAHDAELIEADLTRADLRTGDLTGADAREAELVRADLRGATLNFADLRGAVLLGARLGALRPRLRGDDPFLVDLLYRVEASAFAVDLRGADLRDAEFDDLNLVADLRDADLRGADLHAVTTGCHVGETRLDDHRCFEPGPGPVHFRRLLDRVSADEGSGLVDRLSWIVINAGHKLPPDLLRRALEADVDEILLSPRDARRRLASRALVADVLGPLAGLVVVRDAGDLVLSSNFEGACIDSETVAPKGVDLTELGASPRYC